MLETISIDVWHSVISLMKDDETFEISKVSRKMYRVKVKESYIHKIKNTTANYKTQQQNQQHKQK